MCACVCVCACPHKKAAFCSKALASKRASLVSMQPHFLRVRDKKWGRTGWKWVTGEKNKQKWKTEKPNWRSALDLPSTLNEEEECEWLLPSCLAVAAAAVPYRHASSSPLSSVASSAAVTCWSHRRAIVSNPWARDSASLHRAQVPES